MTRTARRFLIAGLLVVVTPALLVYRACHSPDEQYENATEHTVPGTQALPP